MTPYLLRGKALNGGRFPLGVTDVTDTILFSFQKKIIYKNKLLYNEFPKYLLHPLHLPENP